MKIDTPEAVKKLEGQVAVLIKVSTIHLSYAFADNSHKFQKYRVNSAVKFLELEIIRRGRNPNSDEYFRGNVTPLFRACIY
jgi:hypothetical protein